MWAFGNFILIRHTLQCSNWREFSFWKKGEREQSVSFQYVTLYNTRLFGQQFKDYNGCKRFSGLAGCKGYAECKEYAESKGNDSCKGYNRCKGFNGHAGCKGYAECREYAESKGNDSCKGYNRCKGITMGAKGAVVWQVQRVWWVQGIQWVKGCNGAFMFSCLLQNIPCTWNIKKAVPYLYIRKLYSILRTRALFSIS